MEKNTKNKKKHLSNEERFCIEKMLGAGETFKEIARTLGRGKSTICEEVNSNGGRDKHQAEKAIQEVCKKSIILGNYGLFIEFFDNSQP